MIFILHLDSTKWYVTDTRFRTRKSDANCKFKKINVADLELDKLDK